MATRQPLYNGGGGATAIPVTDSVQFAALGLGEAPAASRANAITFDTGTAYLASVRLQAGTVNFGQSLLNTNASFANPFTTSFPGGITTGDPIDADFAGGMLPRLATTGGVLVLGVGTTTPGLALVAGITTEGTTSAPMTFNVGKNSSGSGAAITGSNLAFTFFNNGTENFSITGDGTLNARLATGTSFQASFLCQTDGVQSGFAIHQLNSGFSNPFTTSSGWDFGGGVLNADFSAGLFNWNTASGGAALIGVSDDAAQPSVAVIGNKGTASTTVPAIRLSGNTQSSGSRASLAATDWLLTVDNNETGRAVWFGDGTFEISTEGLFSKIGNGVLQVHAADGGVCSMFRIEATQANVTAADVFCEFRSTTGVEGSIAGTATAGLIAYNTFTGGHWSQATTTAVPTNTAPGTVLVSTSEICTWTDEVADHLPKCAISSSAADKAVYGVYGGRDIDGDIIVVALGAAKIRVNDEGGAIEIGDLLCTSSTAGVAKKYAGSDPAVVIAKARAAHSASGEVTIPCTMMAG